MARYIERHQNISDSKLASNEDRLKRLEAYLSQEVTDALSARVNLENAWRNCFTDYEGVPDVEFLDIPIEGFKKLSVTIGAIATDTIYAQAVDLIKATTPLITVRPIPKMKRDTDANDTAKAFQRFANWGAENEFGTYDVIDDLLLDDTQLGTGVLYTLYRERRAKTKTAKVLSYGPYTECIAPENVIVPGGSQAFVNKLRWIGIRNYLTVEEMNERARLNKWFAPEKAQPTPVQDMVRSRREAVGRQMEGVTVKGKHFDIYDIFLQYDLDEDGWNEDILVVYNHTGQHVLAIGFNPYDDVPVNVCRYQKRGHLFWGVGVLEMMAPYQKEATDIHNWRNINMYLANCRIWKGKYGSIPETLRIWPSKVIQMSNTDDLKSEAMVDVYPSSHVAEMMVMQLAERRVGVNEMSSPRPSQVMGSRTPGITALSLLQQANRRFVPAFDDMRNCLSGSVKQACFRYKERILAGDMRVIAHIHKVLGLEDGERVVRVLRDDEFEESVALELTASSAIINREADKQNSVMLANILSGYYDKMLQLMMVASNPQIPPEVKQVAADIAKGAYEMMERTIRTFDQVRDPVLFLVDTEAAFDSIQANQGAMQKLMGVMGQMGMGGQPGTQPGGMPGMEGCGNGGLGGLGGLLTGGAPSAEGEGG
jgi:hypothetical protein